MSVDSPRSRAVVVAVAVAMVSSAMIAGVGAGVATAQTSATAATGVSSCTTISSSGTYQLTTNLTNVSDAICINIRADDVVFDGNGYRIDSDGSGLIGVEADKNSSSVTDTITNVTVRGVTVSDWGTAGIGFEDADEGRIVYNRALKNDGRSSEDGISLLRVTDTVVAGNVVRDNDGHGISLDSSDRNDVRNNTAAINGRVGVRLFNSMDNDVRNNVVEFNAGDGVSLDLSRDNLVESNDVTHNDGKGVVIRDSSNETTVRSNLIADNLRAGVGIDDSVSVVVADNRVLRNDVGISGGRADLARIRDNRVRNSHLAGITVTNTDRVEIRRNDVLDNGGDGIYLGELSDFNTVANNTALRNNRSGIYTLLGNQVLVDNVASDNAFHGLVVGGGNSTVLNNTVRFNGIDGLRVNAYGAEHAVRNTLATNNSAFDVSVSGGPATVENTTVDGTTRVSIRGANAGLRSADVRPARPARTEDVGSYVNVTRLGTRGSSFVDLRINYTDSETQGLSESGLRMFRHGPTWTKVPGTNGVDTAANYVYANVTNVTTDGRVYAPLAPTARVTRNVSRIGFDYGQYGGNLNVEVNGDQLYDLGQFDAAPPKGIDGATVGGASVSVTSSSTGSGGVKGHVEITGDIGSFRIGGQEMTLDNVEFGPASNPDANVTFTNPAPNQSRYVVGDTFDSEGVSIRVEEFIYADGTVTRSGAGRLNTGSSVTLPIGGGSQPYAGGALPEFYPGNVNIRFNVTSAVSSAGSRAFDVGVELEQSETVTRRGSTNVSAYVDNRAGQPLSNATVELLVDTDSDGHVESSEVVSSRTVDFAADSSREIALEYADVRLSAGQYAYAARVREDGRSIRSFTNGTLTVTAGSVAAANVSRIGFDYVDEGGSVNLQINGNRNATDDFSDLDGRTIGGVSVSVTKITSRSSSHPYQTGHVELTGPIETFAVGGQETSVDNIEFGPRSNVTANVTFDSVSPTKPGYVVGDSLTVDGVDAEIIDYTFVGGRIYTKGEATLDTGTPQPPGGSKPSLFPSNVNIWFDVTDVPRDGGDGNETGDDQTGGVTGIRSVPDSIRPGGSATVTVETTASNSSLTLQEQFPTPFDSASFESATVNGESVEPLLSPADPEGVVVTLQGLSPGDNVTITYTVSVSSNVQTGTTYEIGGNVTSGTTTSLGTSQVTVNKGSPLEGAPGRYDDDFDGNISIQELGAAGADYANDEIGIRELGEVAAIYARS